MRQDLAQRFARESKSLDTFRTENLAKVARWVYSTEELWSCWDMREKVSEDFALPGPDGAVYAYGFDELGHRIVVRQFRCDPIWVPENAKGPGSPPELRHVPSEEVLSEHFIQYQGECLHIFVIENALLRSVSRLRFQDRRLMESEKFDHGSYRRTLFFYEGGRKKKEQCFSDRERLVMEIHYGSHGEQNFFRVRRDGTLFRLGQPLPKNITLKKLKSTISERLTLLVPKFVARAGITEPIYCVTLAYDGEGNDVLPPLIGIGLESERSRCLAEHGTAAKKWIWNPAQFYNYEKAHTQLEDETLQEACDLLNSYLAERDSIAPAVKVLVEIAGELNKSPWPDNVRKTADFVAYAVDLELGDLRKNMKASISPERFADLKKRKLI
jgi:hypothetical protein